MTNTSLSASSTTRQRYEYGAYAAAEVAAAAAWLALWLLNGFLTVLWLASWGLRWWWGCIAHAVISLIEHHLWKSRRGSKYPLIVVVGAIDVYSSTLGIMQFMAWAGLELHPFYLIVLCTVLAEIVAITPEPNFVGHVAEVWELVRGRKRYE